MVGIPQLFSAETRRKWEGVKKQAKKQDDQMSL
jgi:hypothetical protein